ncbi:hypothetical protein I6F26_26095 [Ensifer sp. IC3342]|nr:hypothetical protein [Ensifer sp. BRP08]MCA1450033.1 hypothetical protein [Ensifer sp. IC3342]
MKEAERDLCIAAKQGDHLHLHAGFVVVRWFRIRSSQQVLRGLRYGTAARQHIPVLLLGLGDDAGSYFPRQGFGKQGATSSLPGRFTQMRPASPQPSLGDI